MKITWIGHSCFKVEGKDYTIVFDPYSDGSVPGLANVREKADLVICSHEHGDHNGRVCVELKESRKLPVQITEIPTYHDDVKGAKRGTNKITLIDDGEFRAAHMGDLGCELEAEQLELLKGLDVMLVPVGGFFTIDAAQAKTLADQVKPKVVIPMHFRSDAFGFDVIAPVDAFTGICENVRTVDSSTYIVEKNTADSVVVLRPQNC